MKDEMLNKWAACLPDREAISNFYNWLCETKGDISLYDIHIDRILDEYHEIDKKQLDKERRALLEEIRDSNK